MSDLITTENEDWALTNQASDTIGQAQESQ